MPFDSLTQPTLIRVSETSQVGSVAGAVMEQLRLFRVSYLQAMGAGAVNQSIKALAKAGEFCEQEHLRLWAHHSFKRISSTTVVIMTEVRVQDA